MVEDSFQVDDAVLIPSLALQDPGEPETCLGPERAAVISSEPDALSSDDADGDGFSPCGGDCNDSNAAINPSAQEVCNGLDDNCDGLVDEGDPGGGGACGITDIGECRLGISTCTGGTLVCVGEVDPRPEVCNGLDDNCDGHVDEGDPGGGGTCGITDIGECRLGISTCTGGTRFCAGEVDPRPEACNGLDDDCDGVMPSNEFDMDHDGYRGCDGDCDDTNAGVNPAATDMPGNLLDEDCDGSALCSPAANWKNTGEFVQCVEQECSRLVDLGKTTQQQCMAVIRAAKTRTSPGETEQTIPD